MKPLILTGIAQETSLGKQEYKQYLVFNDGALRVEISQEELKKVIRATFTPEEPEVLEEQVSFSSEESSGESEEPSEEEVPQL